jgi:hypothetical protein
VLEAGECGLANTLVVGTTVMPKSNATSVTQYLNSLPADRKKALAAVRKVILDNLPEGFEEGMQYGMIGYYVPLTRYPDTYNGQALGIAALASQKQYMSVYLMGVYASKEQERWFKDAYAKSGKKLDMGKSCVRFKSLEDLPLDVIGQAIAKTSVDEFIARVESVRPAKKKSASTKRMPKKTAKPSAKTAAKPSGRTKSSTRAKAESARPRARP